ncbi:MAG: Hpt domain-containing protein [Bacteroidetes bacterium]|nr:Hpt domain-containing protein [Bacteroidota bacterium]
MANISPEYLYQSILNFCSNDESSAKELLALIKSSVAESYETISALQLKENSEEIAQIAHRLRFSFSVIGYTEMQDDAANIENTIVEKEINDGLEKEFEQFKNKFNDLNTTLKLM